MREFKYKSVFENKIIRAAINVESDNFVSKASLNDLRNLETPEDLDLVENPDLILSVYNGAVINRMNRNDDGIDRETAIAIKPYFLHKASNIEHQKKNIVGHIVSVGWSSFGENMLLTDEEVAEMDDPFNLVIGSVVYRLNNEKFAQSLIESTDETSPTFNSISASWEIAFDEYDIILGSKNISEGEIISSERQIKELTPRLKAHGGPGVTKDGVYLGRLIKGEKGNVLPIGFAYTSNPAAEVEGAIVSDFTDSVEVIEEEPEKVEDSFSTSEEIDKWVALHKLNSYINSYKKNK